MFKQAKTFVGEVVQVAKEVSWPDKQTLVELTVVVVFVTALVSIFLSGSDFLFTKLIGLITLRK
ncbi:MAG: preprotein translocase subunit SecE [Patescibacteria group bacterium]